LFLATFVFSHENDYPNWMDNQINRDLSYFKNTPISISELNRFFNDKFLDLYLVKFTIHNNRVYVENLIKTGKGCPIYRVNCIKAALWTLCKTFSLPDMVFLVSIFDGLGVDEKLPVFVMSKKKSADRLILMPDFEALCAKYQVLENQDITKYEFPWDKKQAQLIWRGSTAQRLSDDTDYMTLDNVHLFSRVSLCILSKMFPDLIDAKFTLLAQGGEYISYLQQFKGEFVSFEKQLEYKYHILIDGNSSPYSASGWKFFSNSLIFKPDSSWIQWYYNALEAEVHYIPVKENLDDLVDKIEWAKAFDEEAEIIAQNARQFAINNLTLEKNLIYLYNLLLKYSQLKFIN